MSKQEIMSVREFYKSYALTEAIAMERFRDIRWANGVIHCPYCDKCRITINDTSKQPYRCKDCKKRFTVKTGTILQASKVSVQSWLYTIYLLSVSKKGISSLQLARELHTTQKTAWYMLQKVRECYDYRLIHSGIVEVDETFIGGKEKNKHSDKKLKQGRGTTGKAIVAGIKDRDGFVQGKVIGDTTQDTLETMVLQNVAIPSTVYTDEHTGHTHLHCYGYNHKTVNHSANQYVNGKAHTNGIESLWALLKRAVYGTFHSISTKHLQQYVNEFSFRMNMIKASAVQFIEYTCSHGRDKICTFNDIKGR